MSTNKTTHYGLHQWQPGDSFLREEINENFSALDAASRVTMGFYTGNDLASRSVSLGFRPKAVILTSARNFANGGNMLVDGVDSVGSPWITITDGGFSATHIKNTNNTNNSGIVYCYLAFR